MDKLVRLMVPIYYLALCVTAIPVYKGEKTPLDDIYDICNSVAINRLIFDSSDNLSDFLLSVRGGDDVNALLSALPRNQIDDFIETFGKDLPASGKNRRKSNLLETLNDFRKACIVEYISGEPGVVSKKDAEVYEDIDSDNFTEMRREALRNSNTELLNGSMKRSGAIAVNPTGWRRRRSQTQNTGDTEDVSKFLRNMRELLEKRERLSFNPTGW